VNIVGIDLGSDTVIPSENIEVFTFLFAGGIGGIISRTITAPLERFKLDSQILGKNKLSDFIDIYHHEGIRG